MSRFQIEQLKYAGGGGPGFGGYIEALHILDAPEGYPSFVVYLCVSNRDSEVNDFAEFDNAEHARDAHEATWGVGLISRMKEIWQKSPGFIRLVECGARVPWFYAKPPGEVEGDFAK